MIRKSELLECLHLYYLMKRKDVPPTKKTFTKAIKRKSHSLRSLTWPLTVQRHAYLKYILEAYPYRAEMDFTFDTPLENNIQMPLPEPIYIHAPKLGRHYALKIKKKGTSIMNDVLKKKTSVSSPYPTFLDPLWGIQQVDPTPVEEQTQTLKRKYEFTSLYRPDPLNESYPVFADSIYAVLPDRHARKFQYSLVLNENSMIAKLKDENFGFISDVVTEQCRILFSYLEKVLMESPPDKILNWADVLIAADKSGMQLGFNLMYAIQRSESYLNALTYDPNAPDPLDTHEKKFVSNLRALEVLP